MGVWWVSEVENLIIFPFSLHYVKFLKKSINSYPPSLSYMVTYQWHLCRAKRLIEYDNRIALCMWNNCVYQFLLIALMYAQQFHTFFRIDIVFPANFNFPISCWILCFKKFMKIQSALKSYSHIEKISINFHLKKTISKKYYQ